MTASSWSKVGFPWLAAAGFVAACGTAPPTPRSTLAPALEPSSPTIASASAAPPAVVAPVRPPPPLVTTPMAGEPPPSSLSEARLVGSSCSDLPAIAARIAERRIEAMRAELERSFEGWKESQPWCWEQWRDEGESYGYGFGNGRLAGSHASRAASGAGLGGLSGTARSATVGGVHKTAAPSGARDATSRSGTNNQVASVDEADFVKTDGRYLYLAMNSALRIVEALDPRVVSVTKLPGRVRELFVEGDRAVVYTSYGGTGRAKCTYGYDCEFAGDGSSTKILVFDVANRAAPRLVREVATSGSMLAARRIGRTVHTVVSDGDSLPELPTWPAGMDSCGVKESRVRQRFAELRRDNEHKIRASISFPVIREHGRERALCDHLLRTSLGDGDAFTTLVSFDLFDDSAASTTSTIQSRPGAVFASADALYLSVTHHRDDAAARGSRWYSFHSRANEVSDLHKFALGSHAESTRYVGSGVVPGRVLNQFSMDESFGYLRIATTSGRVPDPNVESTVSILRDDGNGNLVRVGAVEHIAPGEDIRSVRFDDDRGYVVTFKKTDPLFVLDLYDPRSPRILGELKIPGFSSYIQRIDPTHLVSIGFDGEDRGSYAYFDGLLLQLFDVENPTEPKLLFREEIGTRGSSSEAATNHLAFNYFPEKGLLALPATVCEGGGDGRYGELAFSGLLVYRVSLQEGFGRLGGVDHGKEGVHCNNWWTRATSAVKRSVFLDDLVVSIAENRLKVQKLQSLGTDLADLPLTP